MATNNVLNTGVTPLAKTQGGTGVNAAPTTATASSFAAWDANINLPANSFIAGFATTVTSAGTTTLTVADAEQQHFTGTLTQTVVLPVVSTLTLGQSFTIYNASSGSVTVQSSGGNTIQIMTAGTQLIVTCVLTTGTDASSWSLVYSNNAGSTGTVNSSTANNLAYYATSGTAVSGLTTANNGILVTDGSGVPSIGNTVGADLIINTVTVGVGAGGGIGNTVVGADALSIGTAAVLGGTFVGQNAGNLVTTGQSMTIIGNYAYASGAGANFETVVGTGALPSGGGDNTAIGFSALNASVDGTLIETTAVGSSAGLYLETGADNVLVGFGTGTGGPGFANLTDGTAVVLIGVNAGVNASTATGVIAIGAGALGLVGTGNTSGDDSPGFSIGSTSHPVGVRGDGSLYTGGSGKGFWRPSINGAQYFVPLFTDATIVPSASMVTDSNGSPVLSSSMTDGQVMIGQTGGTPVAANLTQGAGISITNAAGGVTIAATGAVGMPFNAISGTTQAAAVFNGYIPTNASLTTIDLPATAAIGSIIAVQGLGTGGWTLVANSGQTIMLGEATTSAAGSLSSVAASDSVWIVCVQADTVWSVYASVSTGLTVA